MANTNLNIRTDRLVKEQADAIFSALGLNMTAAVNLFLRAAIRENGLPFELKLESPTVETLRAIEEGRRIAHDPSVVGFESLADLRASLDV